MNESVKLLLSLSLSGSILATLIFVVKPFIKEKLSKSIQYYIWIVVILRLALPFSFEASIMNGLFYGNQTSVITTSQGGVQPVVSIGENSSKSNILPNVQENANGLYKSEADHGKYFQALFNQYALYLWLLGLTIALTVNVTGYVRFLKYLKQANVSATDEENRLLVALLNGRKNVRLVRNRFVTSPMLIGIIRPYIVIPDIIYNKKQLKNILQHEIVHYKRFDIGVKWLTMIATSIHWFNPLMYFIKKELNHACELACDEAVIKTLSSAEKQAYGETLISVVAEHNYPLGILQATMCEEKDCLKERLLAIMSHTKKSRLIAILSATLLGVVIVGALYLGAGVGLGGKDTPPNLYISTEDSPTKVALTGTYNWLFRGKHIHADSDHPINFNYEADNIVSIGANQQLIIGTQKLNLDKKYNFSVEQISVYRDDQLIDIKSIEPNVMDSKLYLQAPPDTGEYTYSLELNFENNGIVNYGFVARVDRVTYNLAEISRYKTPYVGDHIKVQNITGRLLVPDNYFKQQYISMETSQKPYKLTVYYEAASDTEYKGAWPIVTPDSALETNSRTNALVLFSMIENLDEVTFAYRISQSNGELDSSKYDTTFTFPRASLEEKYGDLTVLGENLDLLQSALKEKVIAQ